MLAFTINNIQMAYYLHGCYLGFATYPNANALCDSIQIAYA